MSQFSNQNSSTSKGNGVVPTLMSAAQFDRFGLPAVLQVNPGAHTPEVAPGTVLDHVLASSVNAADAHIRSGKLEVISGSKFPRVAGFDFAGDGIRVGQGVADFAEGAEVWGYLNNVRNPGPVNATAE